MYEVSGNNRKIGVYGDDGSITLTLSKNYETVNLTYHSDDLRVDSYYGFLPYADTQNPYIEKIVIKDAIETTLNGTTYYVYNGRDNNVATIELIFNEKVNIGSEFKFIVIGDTASGGTKEFEFVCSPMGTNTATNTAVCTYEFAPGDDSYALRIEQDLSFDIYDVANNKMDTFDYDNVI